MKRNQAKIKALSRDCNCVGGKNRDNNYNDIIDNVYDHFEKELHQVREKAQIEISTLRVEMGELEDRSCQGCEYFEIKDVDENGFSNCLMGVETSYKKNVCKSFGCNDFKAKKGNSDESNSLK